jgi:hypothetical protein
MIFTASGKGIGRIGCMNLAVGHEVVGKFLLFHPFFTEAGLYEENTTRIR